MTLFSFNNMGEAFVRRRSHRGLVRGHGQRRHRCDQAPHKFPVILVHFVPLPSRRPSRLRLSHAPPRGLAQSGLAEAIRAGIGVGIFGCGRRINAHELPEDTNAI